jgi:hypothetical protein
VGDPELDPTLRRELTERLARLSEPERVVLERLSTGQVASQDAPAVVVAEIRRKLEVASTLSAVAVLARAGDPPG